MIHRDRRPLAVALHHELELQYEKLKLVVLVMRGRQVPLYQVQPTATYLKSSRSFLEKFEIRSMFFELNLDTHRFSFF